MWDHVLWCDIVYAYGAVWYLVLRDCGRCDVVMRCPGGLVIGIVWGHGGVVWSWWSFGMVVCPVVDQVKCCIIWW